jgi:hypothetical protein
MRSWLLPWLGVLVVAGLLALALLSGSTAQEPKAQRAKWEYKEIRENKLAGEGGLSKLGDEGWELIDVDGQFPYLTRTGTDVNYTERVYYFKRAK